MMRIDSIICYGARYLNLFHLPDSNQHMDMFKQIRRKEMWFYKCLSLNYNIGGAVTTYFKATIWEQNIFDLRFIKEIDKLQFCIQYKALKAQYPRSISAQQFELNFTLKECLAILRFITTDMLNNIYGQSSFIDCLWGTNGCVPTSSVNLSCAYCLVKYI